MIRRVTFNTKAISKFCQKRFISRGHTGTQLKELCWEYYCGIKRDKILKWRISFKGSTYWLLEWEKTVFWTGDHSKKLDMDTDIKRLLIITNYREKSVASGERDTWRVLKKSRTIRIASVCYKSEPSFRWVSLLFQAASIKFFFLQKNNLKFVLFN